MSRVSTDAPSEELGSRGRRTRRVDEREFESFYRSEFNSVLALAYVLTGDLARAEDVTHDVFIAAMESWGDLERPEAWVRRVAANKANSFWRRTYAEKRAVETLSGQPRVEVVVPQETVGFWESVRGLPANQAGAIALYYLEDRPVSEIAEIIGCKESTARVHLTRGRRKLAKILGSEL